MLRFLPILFLLVSCQSFGIKETDTIVQAEEKVEHAIEVKSMEFIHPESEPPYITPQVKYKKQ